MVDDDNQKRSPVEELGVAFSLDLLARKLIGNAVEDVEISSVLENRGRRSPEQDKGGNSGGTASTMPPCCDLSQAKQHD